MKIETDYYVIEKSKDGKLLILQENVDNLFGEKLNQTEYFQDILELYTMDEIVVKIKQREEQIRAYKDILKDMFTEHMGFRVAETLGFINGNVMEGALIDYNSEDTEAHFCFSLVLDEQQVTVWKKYDTDCYSSYRTDYYDTFEEGIGKLFLAIERYALKSLV